MRSVIFKVKIPIPDKDGEYKEYEFSRPDDVCTLLNIPTATMYAIIQGKIKFSHKSIQHLANIKIERIPIEKKNKKKTQKEIEESRRNFEKQLLEKLEQPISRPLPEDSSTV
jgi:hypothetical protein